MRKGYIGFRSRRRRRYKYFSFFVFLLILFFVLLYYNFENSELEIVEIDNTEIAKNSDINIKKIENKLVELEQRLILRDQIIVSLKGKIKFFEEQNHKLNEEIQIKSIENEDTNLKSINLKKDFRKEIDELNKKLLKIEKKYLLLEKENEKKINQVRILENNNKTLEFQNNIAYDKIDELKNELKLKFEELKKKDQIIKKFQDELHH